MNKNIFNILLCVFLYCTISSSQINNSKNETDSNFPNHRLALQLAVGSNFTVKSLDGSMIALKYNFSDKSSIRFGFEFVGSLGETQSNSIGTVSSSNNAENIAVNASFLFNLKPESNFIIYYGAGPRFSFAHEKKGNSYCMNSWAAGLQFNIGVEWFALKNFSFFGEYFAYCTYGGTYKIEREYLLGGYGNVITNTNDWVFDGKTARIGASINF